MHVRKRDQGLIVPEASSALLAFTSERSPGYLTLAKSLFTPRGRLTMPGKIVFQVLYTSEAGYAFTRDDLALLLAGARRRNAAVDLSGMLVFAQNLFLQVLEGRAEDVLATFARIEVDSRHKNITTLFRGNAPAGRLFAEWAMGFHLIADADDLPAGLVRVHERINLAQFDHLSALEFLSACQRSLAPS